MWYGDGWCNHAVGPGGEKRSHWSDNESDYGDEEDIEIERVTPGDRVEWTSLVTLGGPGDDDLSQQMDIFATQAWCCGASMRDMRGDQELMFPMRSVEAFSHGLGGPRPEGNGQFGPPIEARFYNIARSRSQTEDGPPPTGSRPFRPWYPRPRDPPHVPDAPPPTLLRTRLLLRRG